MIKAGILGGETIAAGELIRILINHPDMVLEQVASPEFEGREIAQIHRGLTGDTDITFVSELLPEKLDVVFLCGEPWKAQRFMESLDSETSKELRVIDLTGAFRSAGEKGMVYGFAEYNRKALVRGALHTAVPSALAMAVEVALFPLAKNMLLHPGERVEVNIEMGDDIALGHYVDPASSSSGHQAVENSVRLDPIAPAERRPDAEKASAEIADCLENIQATYSVKGRPNVTVRLARTGAIPRGIVARTILPDCRVSQSDLCRMFQEAYEDHSFAYLIDEEPTALDVANTNKCLIHVGEAGIVTQTGTPRLCITTAIDHLLKGSAGTAVHCMNLLFGLSERTGLALKASAY